MRQNLKSIEELKEVPYPQCFPYCAVAQFSDNAYASCEVHCLNKICDSSFNHIERVTKDIQGDTYGSTHKFDENNQRRIGK